MTLRSARALGETFDARFFERDERFWPIARAASRFAERTDWPAPEEHVAEGVRFVTAKIAKPRRHRRKMRAPVIDKTDLYDAHIVRGTVPTRPRCWHDYLNALVWATFPKSKAALHRRQLRAMLEWIPDGATELPNARTREHDALALVDEGGVILLGGKPIAFGHALFEGLVHGVPAMIARAIPFSVSELPRADLLPMADELLASRLEAPLVPEDLPRFPFST
jgi:hypothetical protein